MEDRVCPECGSELNGSGMCTNVLCDYIDAELVAGSGAISSTEIVINVRGELVRIKDTKEEWEELAERLGLKIFRELAGGGNYVSRYPFRCGGYVLYNPKNFVVDDHKVFIPHLRCISEENLELPINCSFCYGMFQDFKFENKDALKNFDTSGVRFMDGMFSGCTFPEGFSLGSKFDTSSVGSMVSMFKGCSMPKSFSLGEKFDTSNVVDMQSMFASCKFSDDFSLGEKFDTSKVEIMMDMFENCTLPEQFSLGCKFDTSNVEYIVHMFGNCTFPEQFSLGESFNISNVRYRGKLFEGCALPEGKTEKDFNDELQIVEWLKSRNR